MIKRQINTIDQRLENLERTIQSLSAKINQNPEYPNLNQHERHRVYLQDNFSNIILPVNFSPQKKQSQNIHQDLNRNNLHQRIQNLNIDQNSQQSLKQKVKGWSQFTLFLLCITSILLVGGTFMFIFGIYKLSTEFNYICEDNNYYQRNGICFYYGCPSCDYYTKIATKQTILAPGLPLLIFGILCKIAGTVFLQKTYKFYHDNNGKWFD